MENESENEVKMKMKMKWDGMKWKSNELKWKGMTWNGMKLNENGNQVSISISIESLVFNTILKSHLREINKICGKSFRESFRE